jgi:hypothetical protein
MYTASTPLSRATRRREKMVNGRLRFKAPNLKRETKGFRIDF